MTTPELRLIRYFVAVAELGNVTHAAERLHISQPSLSVAIKQLEGQLGVELLAREGRSISLTPAGSLLLQRGRALLEQADVVFEEVRRQDLATAGRLRLGLSPTARFGVGPKLLAACAAQAAAVMIYTSEDTTGALLRDLSQGRLDLAVTFCAPEPPEGIELLPLCEERAIVHLTADHPLAERSSLDFSDLAEETILIAAGQESSGFTRRVIVAFKEHGIEPRTQGDPYPDLGLQAVREHRGVVVYVRGAFPAQVEGSAFVPLEPSFAFPFHLATPVGAAGAPVRAVIDVAAGL